MSDRIDHAAKAREALNAALENPAEGQVTDPWLLAAQALATLALVEQQRIATLIALAESCHPLLREQVADDAAATLTVAREHDDERLGGWHELAPDIAAALGIEVRDA